MTVSKDEMEAIAAKIRDDVIEARQSLPEEGGVLCLVWAGGTASYASTGDRCDSFTAIVEMLLSINPEYAAIAIGRALDQLRHGAETEN